MESNLRQPSDHDLDPLMPEYDDYEFNPDNRVEEVDEPELHNQSWTPDQSGGEGDGDGPKKLLVVLLLVVFVLGILGAWWWWRSFKSAAAEVEPIATTAAERPAPQAPPPIIEAEEEVEPVSLSNSDEVLRTVVGAVSSHPRLAAWLVNDGLIERFVKVATNVAYGEDPKSHVPFLRPGRSFSATERDGATVISGGSFARFTPYIEVMESVDAAGAGSLYQRFEPAMEEVFSELGYPGTFRETLDRAVTRILSVDVPGGNLEVEEGVLSYRFADDQLENAQDLDKLLYRMGPDNQRRLRSEVRRLSRALP